MTEFNKNDDLTGKTVLITGGATGIGLAMTRALAKSGAKVMMAARREGVLKRAAENLKAEGIEVLWYTVDLSDRKSVKALSAHALETLSGVDIFIGNAGMERLELIDVITDAALDEQIRVNLAANIELTRDLLPSMRKKQWGRFIFCSSAASQQAAAGDGMSIYGTVKSALNGFTKYVAAEAGHDGITANSLILGMFLTDMTQSHLGHMESDAAKTLIKEASSVIALGRPADTDEISGLIRLLASNSSSYITGACLAIDGGMTAMLRPNPIESTDVLDYITS